MKIAVCDSDKDFLNKVEVILQKLSKNNEVPYITFKYENSYDPLIFGQSVSDEYLKLFCNGVFEIKELDKIRENGVEVAREYNENAN